LTSTAKTLPAPFRAVLRDLATQGSHEINLGIGELLARQMEAAIGDTCRQTVDGSYPFARDSGREISSADFARMFAQGGVIDGFFTKTLAPFVDTSARPWRYKTLPGATEPLEGPDLEPFQRAKAIRDTFFGDSAQKQPAWKTEIRVVELDPNLTDLQIDVDGQTTLYRRGPWEPSTVNWPGPRGGAHAQIAAIPGVRAEKSIIEANGPWALMRLMDKGLVIDSATPGRARVAFDFDGRTAVLDVGSPGNIASPLTGDLLTRFRCPSSIPMFRLLDTGPPEGLPAEMQLGAPPGLPMGMPPPLPPGLPGGDAAG
jgi:type VI secretion system protein ImpL